MDCNKALHGVGLWATSAGWSCPCSLHGGWTGWSLWSLPIQTMLWLWFCNSMIPAAWGRACLGGETSLEPHLSRGGAASLQGCARAGAIPTLCSSLWCSPWPQHTKKQLRNGQGGLKSPLSQDFQSLPWLMESTASPGAVMGSQHSKDIENSSLLQPIHQNAMSANRNWHGFSAMLQSVQSTWLNLSHDVEDTTQRPSCQGLQELHFPVLEFHVGTNSAIFSTAFQDQAFCNFSTNECFQHSDLLRKVCVCATWGRY